MRDLKYRENYVWKCLVVLAGNVLRIADVANLEAQMFNLK